jgi:hypothetical protein
LKFFRYFLTGTTSIPLYLRNFFMDTVSSNAPVLQKLLHTLDTLAASLPILKHFLVINVLQQLIHRYHCSFITGTLVTSQILMSGYCSTSPKVLRKLPKPFIRLSDNIMRVKSERKTENEVLLCFG